MTRRFGVACLLVLGTAPAGWCQSASIRRAAATITEADIRRRILLIAADSMGGRNTPSPGLTKTANYIAREFKRFGLKPGGDGGSYLLSYPMARKQLLAAQSSLRFGKGSSQVATTLADAGALISGATSQSARGGILLVGGRVVADSLTREAVRDRIVIYLPAPETLPATRDRISPVTRLSQLGARAIVLVVRSDSVLLAYQQRARRPQTVVGDPDRTAPVIAVLENAIARQAPGAAEQFARLRTAPGTIVQQAAGWEGELALRDTTLALSYAPNVVGILEGSDPRLKQEYVVFSAHMDHIGTAGQPGAQCGTVQGDGICNGADDDGSGTVGVVELAEAFSQRGARPKRSLIFLTVSGEEEDLWGSRWFVNHPPVPLSQIVADLNADMIGRNWKDTIVAIGKQHSDLGTTLDRVNAAHPELRMHAIDDRWPEEDFYRRSDHYNFAQRGVPILFFFNGVHADYHQPSDSPDKIDAEKEARVVRLLFYLGQEIATLPERPKWVPASYQQIVVP